MTGLRRLTGEIAVGQITVGIWGHNWALPSGNREGYGSMNSPGITITLALVVAREAGVTVLDKCIADIEASTDLATMVPLKDFAAQAATSGKAPSAKKAAP